MAEFRYSQQAKIKEQRAKINKKRAKSNEQRAESNEQRAKSNEQRAKSSASLPPAHLIACCKASLTVCRHWKIYKMLALNCNIKFFIFQNLCKDGVCRPVID